MFDTLYLKRPLENADEFISWAKSQGFETTIPASDLHVTIAFSKSQLEWPEPRDDRLTVVSKKDRIVQALGDGGAVVLRFDNSTLQARWKELVDSGASWDFPEYKPHVTISWDAGDVDLSNVVPYEGPLIFGPEIMKPIDESWKDKLVEKIGSSAIQAKVTKVDSELGIVFGWALVSKVHGEEYWDLQDHHVPEEVMLDAVAEFSEGARIGKEMHVGGKVGKIVFTFPLTKEIAKSMDIVTKYAGWMIGFKPSDEEVLKKFKNGDYTGFSIGGFSEQSRDVD